MSVKILDLNFEAIELRFCQETASFSDRLRDLSELAITDETETAFAAKCIAELISDMQTLSSYLLEGNICGSPLSGTFLGKASSAIQSAETLIA